MNTSNQRGIKMIESRVRNYGKKYSVVTLKADLDAVVLTKKELEELRDSLLDMLESINSEINVLTE